MGQMKRQNNIEKNEQAFIKCSLLVKGRGCQNQIQIKVEGQDVSKWITPMVWLMELVTIFKGIAAFLS
jgi:hypothetical protein